MRLTKPLVLLSLLLAAGCVLPTAGGGRAGPPRDGGLLAIATLEPKTLDPSASVVGTARIVAENICRPLVEADPITGDLRPGAAESWEVADDAKRFTFHLRAGVKFHNGREVVSDDYVFSLTRFAAKDPAREQSLDRSYFLEHVAGFTDLRQGRSQTLAGIRAIDAKTLQIDTSAPFAELPAVLSHPAVGSALPKEEVAKGAEFAAKPVCDGPYMFTEKREAGKDFRLVRFTDYLAESSAYSQGGRGFAHEIRFVIVGDFNAGFNRLLDGSVVVTAVSADRLVEARRVRGRVESRPNGILAYIGFPVTVAPYNDLVFRRALAVAIDRKEIIDGLLAGSRAMPLGFLPPGAGAASRIAACRTTIRPGADPEEARAALKVSKVEAAATKPKIYFNDGGSGHETWLQAVADQWKSALGIESTLVSNEYLKYLDALVAGVDGPFRQAWTVEYPSPEALLGSVFMGDSLDNYMKYRSSEFDDLMRKARSTVDVKDRLDLYVQASRVLCKDLPAVPMWFTENHYAFHNTIVSAKGQRLDINGNPLLKELGRRAQ